MSWRQPCWPHSQSKWPSPGPNSAASRRTDEFCFSGPRNAVGPKRAANREASGSLHHHPVHELRTVGLRFSEMRPGWLDTPTARAQPFPEMSASHLPTGRVTFLFTDIEGSTMLLQELGPDGYAEALAEQRRCLRAAFAAHDGVEVDTQGDAFFAAFPEASGALAAAEQAQFALASGPIRVRIGIHSGEPLVTTEGYVGIDVHRGARVMGAGHGGQVLVTEATHALLHEDSHLINLGRHRLKDLTEPQTLYQLGEREFPPLKTLYQTNLPVQPTPLVGRDVELAEVLELLSASRLLTLTGAGGSGKTRLALQAAAEVVDDYKDGVWWVSLAAVRDPELVVPTIAAVLGAREQLAQFLDERRLVLLLDNLEQILPGASALAELLASCPNLKLLATSRAPLRIAGEQEYEVPLLREAAATELFTQRARQVRPAFEPNEHVVEICRRLEGLPLALELAAVRTKLLSAEQILERLGQSLELLTTRARDVPERRRTLRATIEWSYQLLDEEEKRLYARLAAFAGSFDLEAAEAVGGAGLDTLEALVDQSLLRQAHGGRFFMLETIREYALERLDELGETEELRCSLADFYLVRVESIEQQLFTGDQRLALDEIQADFDNLRAVIDRALEQEKADVVLRLAGALEMFWHARGHVTEVARWIEAAFGPVTGGGTTACARQGPLHPGVIGRAHQRSRSRRGPCRREPGDTRAAPREFGAQLRPLHQERNSPGAGRSRGRPRVCRAGRTGCASRRRLVQEDVLAGPTRVRRLGGRPPCGGQTAHGRGSTRRTRVRTGSTGRTLSGHTRLAHPPGGRDRGSRDGLRGGA
jgi:predicted ATPase/class 3 adenylate cyclase